MSRSDYNCTERQRLHIERYASREKCRFLHGKLLALFITDTDFPLHIAKPTIDNRPQHNEPPRIYPRPARGSKRAFLRRMEAGRV